MINSRIVILDEDPDVRASLYTLLADIGYSVRTYGATKHFLADYTPLVDCVIVNMQLPEFAGFELQQELRKRGINVPLIFTSDHADVPLAVRAMKTGAVDVLVKPINNDVLIVSIADAILSGLRGRKTTAEMQAAHEAIARLTPREKHVMDQIAKGRSNKIAAYELGISARTVEFHRARIMEKLNARHSSDMVRMALAMEKVTSDAALPVMRHA